MPSTKRHKPKSKHTRSKKSGMPPGSIVHIGDERTDIPRLSVIQYDANGTIEETSTDFEELVKLKIPGKVFWLHIEGIHDVALIEKLGAHFHFHPLLLEDIANSTQRPKVEAFDDYLFLTLRRLTYENENEDLVGEQISFILGADFVISLQEKPNPIFEPIRQRLINSKGRFVSKGSDYLLYTLLDIIVDSYFEIIETIGNQIEALEERIFNDPQPELLHSIHKSKSFLLILRRSIFPLREVVNQVQKNETNLIEAQTSTYFRDVYDHTIQLIETLESYRDINTSLKDMYLSSISLKMNQIMKVLTIISTIFIPLTFITGIYGMNFDTIPELHWRYGYFGVWGVMVVCVLGLLFYFYKKKWW